MLLRKKCCVVDPSNVIYRNFSKRHKVPDLLKAHSEDIIDLLWESALIGICLVNKDGKFLRVNSTFCQLVKYTEVELMNMTFMEITIDEDIKNDMKSAKRVAEGEIEHYDMAKTYETKLKESLVTMLRVMRIEDGEGNFICFLSQILPIKEQVIEKPSKVKKMFGVPLWTVITGIVSGVAYLIAEVVKILTKSGGSP